MGEFLGWVGLVDLGNVVLVGEMKIRLSHGVTFRFISVKLG